MKTKTLFCALALMATAFATAAHAEARNYLPFKTTALRLADQAQAIVTGKLLRVENVNVPQGNLDAARHARKDDGQWQDGQDGIRREAVIQVSDVLKGSVAAGSELRVVSMRQLQFGAYDDDLRTGDALYFISTRAEDGRNIVLMDERGTISAPECNNSLAGGVDFLRGYLTAPNKGAYAAKLIDAIDLKGGRLSVDASIELSWNHEDYALALTEENRQRIMALAKLSKVGSAERNELITAIGRHKPEGGFEALFEIMLGDSNWSTTSLASMSLEYIDRGAAIARLHQEWDAASGNTTRMVIVRSLGLIRPKADHDGQELRNRTLQIVGGLLITGTEKNLLREALIASRDLRSEGAHINALKTLINEREINGLTDVEVKGAIVALAAARKVVKSTMGPDVVTVLEKTYLTALANSDPVLKQVVDAALVFPYTTLIVGADGLGH